MRYGPLILVLALALTGPGVALADAAPDYDPAAFADAEVAFILSCRHPSGAILTRPLTAQEPQQTYNPYFACQAMLGLVRSGRELGVVRSYIEFHLGKLNRLDSDGLAGSIYDYTATADCLVPTYDYDSTDSYAALALVLIDEYIKATGDTAVIANRCEDINLLCSAMVSTLDEGLTLAKPNYPVKYLMDNCEVYQGHLAAAGIYETALGRPDMAESHRYYADAMKARILEVFWLPDAGLFAPAVQEGVVTPPNWSTFYPDAAAQMSPELFGIIEPSDPRAGTLWASFLAHYPRWAEADLVDKYVWALLTRAARDQGDQATLNAFLRAAWQKYGSRTHEAPWYCAESGAILEALTEPPTK